MLEKIVNQPAANSSERVCYIPDVVVTEATRFGNIAHNTHGCRESALLFVLGAFLKVSSTCQALHLLSPFVCAQLCTTYSHFILPITEGIIVPIYR